MDVSYKADCRDEITPVSAEAFMDLTEAFMGLADVLKRTDRDWKRFIRAYRNACSGPLPLCIDGHEYRRRCRRRTKSKRKR